ncbi:MAG: sialidase family protein [Pseudomonadota bacterium]
MTATRLIKCICLFTGLSSALGFAPVIADSLDCAQKVSLHCGNTPSATFDDDGTLWVAFEYHDHVYVTSSDDQGQSFSEATAVNALPEKIYARGENRPKIAVGDSNRLFVSWTHQRPERFSGDIRFAYSSDGGYTFSVPITVNNDGLITSHRFDALYVADTGDVFVSWLDKRDQVRVRAMGEHYHGAALYYAVSNDGGESFTDNYKVADHSCECCRIAVTGSGPDKAKVMWRHIFDTNTRDHAAAVLSADGSSTMVRGTRDDWQIDACPHHGPSMAASNTEGVSHIAWFSDGSRHRGLYYKTLNIEQPMQAEPRLMDDRPGAGHPQIASAGDRTVYLWKFFDGKQAQLLAATSEDDGVSWGERINVMSTAGGSDHPQLVTLDQRIFAAWHSDNEGFRFVELQ